MKNNRVREKGKLYIKFIESTPSSVKLKVRNVIIKNNTQKLIKKIKSLINKDTNIILIKKNVYSLLSDKIRAE